MVAAFRNGIEGAMQPEFYRQVFSVQTKHWWGRNRRKLSLDLLKKFGASPGTSHLDVGCGTGQNLRLLDSLDPARIVGVDLSPIALEFARKACPKCELVRSDLNHALPFADQSFDVATIFSVLYHRWINSELAVLTEVRRILRPGGLLLITEPAFAALAREIDIIDMAARRYRLRPFVDLLREAEFDVVSSNYFTSFGAPIILGMNAIKALRKKSYPAPDAADMRPMNPLINSAFYAAARIEASLVKAAIPLPFGTTLICVARRC
jgi:ubiquinone/menaquinone biosynthesis C-methylase UbiE